jgi:hypothetical protein
MAHAVAATYPAASSAANAHATNDVSAASETRGESAGAAEGNGYGEEF